jgi:pimeloyl-ACP methyl ester carboxylesterase
MNNLRRYGKAPFNVAIVHGGPGAVGEMTPVALELAPILGILEPLQTATSLAGQVEELKTVLQENADLPVTLIGFSWGAWLSFIVAASHPTIVKKLILVGSGPYEHKYAKKIQETRLSRLSEVEGAEYKSMIQILNDPAATGKPAAFARLGALASKTDTHNPTMNEPHEYESVSDQGNRFHSVLAEALEMRRSGKLLELAERIQCPVVAIHGDYDPHPAEGVKKPLSAILKSFRFILLKQCGHKPWIERQAQDKFYEILKEELRRTE